MKRRALLAVAALLATVWTVLAAPVGGAAPLVSEPLRIDAAAWYLEGEDGAVLAQRRSRQPRAMASITKLMTALVTVEQARLSDVVTITPEAAAVGGSTAFLRAGERLTVAQLLQALLVQSANDAAVALALHVGGGSVAAFVEAMNEKAAEVGLADTRFANPHGLDAPGHHSSARDTTILLRRALGVPYLRDALGRESVTLPDGRSFPAQDDLVSTWAPLVGGKTGHTDDAGWSEAGAARAKGVTVYGTVLGTDSREKRNAALRALLEHGLDQYRRVTAVGAGRVYAEAETGYGRPPVELVARRSLVRTVREGMPLVERIVAPEAVGIPVEAGARVGRVEVYDGARLLASSELVAGSSVSEPGPLGKALWYAETTAENVWGIFT